MQHSAPVQPMHLLGLSAHAALVAHMLAGVDDAAVGLCITVLSDLQGVLR